MKNRIWFYLMLPLLSVLVACSANQLQTGGKRPQFYPNAKYRDVGAVQAESDADTCMELADQYVKDPNRYKDVAAGTLEPAIVGAAAGAVGGAIVSNAGRGTAVGAATGAIIGLLRELQGLGEGDPNYQLFVSHCLRDRGYEVYSWQ